MPITRYEIEYAEKVVGRRLTDEEKALLEAEWSEHCSYKSTRIYLKKLPTSASWVVLGPGRDAGAVKLFDDVILAARIESHNHPSAIDPYNGAATGVGGIIRDVLSVGAQPVLLMDILYLGDLKDSHSRWVARGIIKGISDYGNRVGIPTAGGALWFSRSYGKQPIVNVACIGIIDNTRGFNLLPGRVEPGDKIIIAGNTTGRDGMLGSSFASKPLEDKEELGAIQVGNPFLEKLLVDALVEAFQKGVLKHVKDLGGGGLATAITETAAQSNVGVIVFLEELHLREELAPVEILVSESQERMLLVPYRGKEKLLLDILEKYGVEYSLIGYFTNDKQLRIYYKRKLVVDLPVKLAVSPPPIERRIIKPFSIKEKTSIDLSKVEPASLILSLLSTPNIASKHIVYETYDWGVGGQTVLPPGYGDAAVIWLKEKGLKGFAVAARGNPRYTKIDPYKGAILSFSEAYRRVASVGAEPLAALDAINSGNPEKPEQHYYTVEMIRGIADAAKKLGIPIIGGNISLYNEDSEGRMIDPVTTVMVIGRINDITRILPSTPNGDGLLVLAGETFPEIGASEALETIMGRTHCCPPKPRLYAEKKLAYFTNRVAKEKLANSAHSVGLGGIIIASIKMGLKIDKGVIIDLTRVCSTCSNWFEAGFSETPARIIFEVPENKIKQFYKLAEDYDINTVIIGRFTDHAIKVTYQDKIIATLSIEDAIDRYMNSLERILKGIG